MAWCGSSRAQFPDHDNTPIGKGDNDDVAQADPACAGTPRPRTGRISLTFVA